MIMSDASQRTPSNLAAMHRHRHAAARRQSDAASQADDPNYTAVNYEYAGRTGHVHEVVEIGGRSLAKIGFDDRKIVYYFLDDLELDEAASAARFTTRAS